MTTATTNFASQGNTSPIAAPTLLSIVSALLCLNLREKLSAESTADQGDAAYHYGM